METPFKLLRNLTPLLLGLLISSQVFGMDANLFLVFDRSASEAQIARRFRSALDLQASASGQFSADELIKILNTIPTLRKNIWIVDLRQESHAFIDGLPVSWVSDRNAANMHKEAKQIERDEMARIKSISGQKSVKVYHLKKLDDGKVDAENPTIMIPESVEAERDLVLGLDAKYARLYVLDHNKPNDMEVDNFVMFIKSKVRAEHWLHFHCRGGAGRSSTFIAMYDMIKNAPDLTFIEIMQRQAEMGNINLSEMPTTPNKVWKAGMAQERYAFLCKFYAYVIDPKGYAVRSWSEWQKL